ncbi:Crp/Fnr family transcriptional regulator [Dinghuibacter silviterrae]|uniref:CRP-like cAMP-binding protein n=1 Tax=Dinghuibacter silviterrae TaxID=1539049 RepID=A0A4V3GLU3_9BACT|nr:Crp/Fnr family transcriptional regulator [Dinghuibacter silviterrae]TDX00893.1 CRP-like cAMP-binding protein [Dinghuibacter silviterrae]
MHEALFRYIEERSGLRLTEGDQVLIESKFRPKKMRRKQYFLQEGDICKTVAFITKGAARMFSVDDKGHEHIVRFGLENWWLGDQESFSSLTPSRYHIEMLEDSDLLVITVAHAYELMDQVRAVDLMIKAMDRQMGAAAQKRINAALSMTAEERYEDLAKNYPQFLQRFPQNMIASYLGVSPETLSRIRRKN